MSTEAVEKVESAEQRGLYLIKWKDVAQAERELAAANLIVRQRYALLPDVLAVSLPPSQVDVWKQHPNVMHLELDGMVSVRGMDAEESGGADSSGAVREIASSGGAGSLQASERSNASKADDGFGYGFAETLPALEQIGAKQVQDDGVYGVGVNVAILDTGINTASQRVRVAGGVSFVEQEADCNDLHGHGTTIAGLIGLQHHAHDAAVGVAPDAALYAVKVLNGNGVGCVSAVLDGLEWAIEHGMHIATLCFGTLRHSPVLEEALDMAFARGLLLVAPTGNIGAVGVVDVPARYRSVIAVGAVDASSRLAPFSNQGAVVELVAPGVSVRGLYLHDLPLLQSGTSLSAAYVAGVAALLKSAEPALDAQDVRFRLVKSAMPLGELDEREQYGYGLVNACGALIGAGTARDIGASAWLENAATLEPVSVATPPVIAPDFTLPVETPVSPALPPEETLGITDIPPSARPAEIKRWYLQASPYEFSILDPLTFQMQDLYYGIDVEIFAQWEADSNRVNDARFATGDVNYWEYVNARFMRDIAEAERLVENGETASHYRVQRLVDYLKAGKAWNAKHGQLKFTTLYKLLQDGEAHDLYRHLRAMSVSFWLSHNTSILYWDKRARERAVWQAEEATEAHFVNGVIVRLDFSADMPFNVPPFGNNTPPIGLIGYLLHRGPFKYPDQYPAPKPPVAPPGTLDYDDETTVQLVMTYLKYLLEDGTSSVFTWWLPTPADRELAATLQQKGLTLNSSPNDWKREILDPTWKSVEELQAKYLQDEASDMRTIVREVGAVRS